MKSRERHNEIAIDAVYIWLLFFLCVSNLYSGHVYITSFKRQMTVLSPAFVHSIVSGFLHHRTKGSKSKLGHIFRVPPCHLDTYFSAVVAPHEGTQIA